MTGRPAKPTVAELGIDVQAQAWQRSGGGAGAIEIAFVGIGTASADDAPASGSGTASGSAPASGSGTASGSAPASGSGLAPGGGEWVLMRVAGDPAERVLVYDRNEWECFLDGVKNGEFDDAAELPDVSSEHPARYAKLHLWPPGNGRPGPRCRDAVRGGPAARPLHGDSGSARGGP